MPLFLLSFVYLLFGLFIMMLQSPGVSFLVGIGREKNTIKDCNPNVWRAKKTIVDIIAKILAKPYQTKNKHTNNKDARSDHCKSINNSAHHNMYQMQAQVCCHSTLVSSVSSVDTTARGRLFYYWMLRWKKKHWNILRQEILRLSSAEVRSLACLQP